MIIYFVLLLYADLFVAINPSSWILMFVSKSKNYGEQAFWVVGEPKVGMVCS